MLGDLARTLPYPTGAGLKPALLHVLGLFQIIH